MDPKAKFETKVLASVETNTTKKEIVISEYKGVKYLQVRQLWKPKDNPQSDWNFSKKIVSFNFEDAVKIIDDLKKIKELEETILTPLEEDAYDTTP